MNRLCTFLLAALMVVLADCCLAQSQGLEPDQMPRETFRHPVRLIDDSSNHGCWMFFADPSHPARPARLTRLTGAVSCKQWAEAGGSVSIPASMTIHHLPVIHAGDVLNVVQHTSVADVHLEGTALGPAEAGQTVRVRLKCSGAILRARADSPGLAIVVEGKNGARW